MSLLPRRPILLLLLVTGVTLAVEFVRPSRAFAECGDYIVYANRADGHHPDMPADGPKPVGCHGPHCTHQPPSPASPSSPTKTRAAADDRAGLETTAGTPDHLSLPFSYDLPLGRAIRRGTDVFHPPR